MLVPLSMLNLTCLNTHLPESYRQSIRNVQNNDNARYINNSTKYDINIPEEMRTKDNPTMADSSKNSTYICDEMSSDTSEMEENVIVQSKTKKVHNRNKSGHKLSLKKRKDLLEGSSLRGSKLSANLVCRKSLETKDIEKKHSQYLCKVCGDSASRHVHYGGRSCHSCRAFFKRTIDANR